MTVLIDSNVALDALLNNVGFVDKSKELFDLAYKKRFTGYISASAVTPEQFMRIIADTEQ